MIGAALAGAALSLGLGVALLTGDSWYGLGVGSGVLAGGAGSLLLVRAVRPRPAGAFGAAVHDSSIGWDEFHRELARARRFDRQLGIVRFSRDESVEPSDLGPLRDEIAAASRRIDRLWTDGEHILMLLPEATPIAVETVLARIAERVPAAVVSEPSVALFPEHGLTSGALIAAVYGGGKADAPTPIGSIRPDVRLAGVDVQDAVDRAEVVD